MDKREFEKRSGSLRFQFLALNTSPKNKLNKFKNFDENDI